MHGAASLPVRLALQRCLVHEHLPLEVLPLWVMKAWGGSGGGVSLDGWKERSVFPPIEEILQDEMRQLAEKPAPRLSSQSSSHCCFFLPGAFRSILVSVRGKQSHLWVARKPFSPLEWPGVQIAYIINVPQKDV